MQRVIEHPRKLTREQLTLAFQHIDQLPPEDKKKVLAEIARRIKKKQEAAILTKTDATRPNSLPDLSVVAP